MSGAPAASNSSLVAVLYSGWLSVRTPKRGFAARHNLIDVLAADVFIAGTYLPNEYRDCQQRTQCLLRRLDGLRPFTRVRVDPMLTLPELQRRVAQSPNWPAVSKQFVSEKTHYGINVFAPVLGNGNLSVLRELHDYSRALRLVEVHEKSSDGRGGRRYSRLVFSRLEFEWLAPHPPLALLEPASAVWLPSGGVSGGLNDRHALLERSAADVYFKRWQLLFSTQLFQRVPPAVVLRDGPEKFLEAVLHSAHLAVRYFPSTMVLGCCSAAAHKRGRCYGSSVCVHANVRTPRGPRQIGAKYFDELKFAFRHAAAFACPGARFMRVSEAAARAQDGRNARPREPGLLIGLPAPRLSRWHPDGRARGEGGSASSASASSSASSSAVAMASRAAADGSRLIVPAWSTFVRILTPAAVAAADSATAAEKRPRGNLHAQGGAVPGGTNWSGLQAVAERPLIAMQLSPTVQMALGGDSAAASGSHSIERLSARLSERFAHCPVLPRNWWPVGAVDGYCEATDDEGDCETGSKGSFKDFERRGLWRGETLSIRDCAEMCSKCKRCNYISLSLSPDVTDCSWYNKCDLARTQRLRGANFVSMSITAARTYARRCRAHFRQSVC